MYKYILFDLDGTLTDPAEGITNSVAYALDKFGITVEDKTQLNVFIGPPLVETFMSFAGLTEEDANRAVTYYREYFKPKGIFQNKMYSGVPELLQKLKADGKSVILATSKPEVFAKDILAHFGIEQYFDFAAGASWDLSRNKKADVIAYALESCGITEKDKCLMVGDRKHDINGAQENQIDSLGVLFGYGSLEELQTAGATYIAQTVEDIIKFI